MEIPKEVAEMIEQNVVAIGSVGEYPSVTPVLFCKVVGDQIIITNNFMEGTLENIKSNNKICLAVWDDTPNKEHGYKLFGSVAYYDNGKWLDFVKKMKENEGLPARGALVFTPKGIKKI